MLPRSRYFANSIVFDLLTNLQTRSIIPHLQNIIQYIRHLPERVLRGSVIITGIYLGAAQLVLALALAGTAVVHGSLGIIQIGMCMARAPPKVPEAGIETEVEASVEAGADPEVGASVEQGVGVGRSQWNLFDEHARYIDDQSRHVEQLAASVSQQFGLIKAQMGYLFPRRAGSQGSQRAQQVLGQ